MINTRGFNVQNMPEYTPVDPRLVAFNPAAIPEGILSSFKIADTYKKMAAFDKLQKEYDSTRDQRINATGLGHDADALRSLQALELTPMETKLRAGEFAQKIKQQPLQGLLSDAALQHQMDSQPYKQDVELADLMNQFGNIENTGRISALNSQNDLALAERRGEMESTESAVKLQSLNDALKNATTDAERMRLLKDAQLELTYAHTESALADAMYKRGEGRQSGHNIDRTNSDINAIQRYIDSLDKKALPNGKTLNVYIDQTYNPDGTRKTEGVWGFQTPVPIDPVAERMIKNRNIQQKRLDALIESASFSGQFAPPQSGGGITPITVPGLVPNRSTPQIGAPAIQGPAPAAPQMPKGKRVEQDGIIYEQQANGEWVPTK